MSFSPRNVSQLLVGTTDVSTVDALTNVGDYAIVPSYGTGVDISATGTYTPTGARIAVKTSTGVKFSDFVPGNANYKAAVITAGTAQSVVATYQAPASFADQTFKAVINFHDHIGSMLNDRFISAYVAVDADGNFIDSAGVSTVASLATVLPELNTLLTATINQTGGGFTVANTVTTITVTQIAPEQVLGVKDGIALPWEFIGGSIKDDINGGSYVALPAANVVTAPVADGLVQLKNVEWFNSGYDKDPYRETGYPASFAVDSNITAAGVALTDAYGIFQFYKDRDATNVERQHRQLIVVGIAAAALYAAATTDITVI